LRKYTILIILGLVALSACERETIVTPADEQRDQIRVVGTATVRTSPDIATAQIGVQTFSKEVEPAITENNKKSEAVQEALRQQGVEEKDMRTIAFNVYPQRDYENNRPEDIIGYQVNNTISVVLRDLSSVGKTLQAAITAGANNISGVTFTLSDPESFRDDARIKAIEDARRKAESMAEAADIELGKVISMAEVSQSGSIVARAAYDEDAFEKEVPIQPGELELTVSVEMVFEIP
jgi:uncharacterized protein YggE